ncbi:AraC family transcriptional regulator [Variovorax soli]|jgi:AraC-like DNA-binding protein|uniref:AraC family transcriptional regulator n=1 Tax=Variovorax soli TaxID=376815 RepID=UPI00083886D1|nr:AraC family transcriptional regulator [Variovorax soli]
MTTFFIRAAAVSHYPAIARRHGLDAGRMLARAGIPRECLHDPELLIPMERAYGLLEDSVQASGVRSFGLEMGEANQLSTLGLLGLILREESTLRDAVQTLIHYRKLHNESLVLRLEESSDDAVLHMEFAGPGAGGIQQAVEQGLAMLVRSLRSLMPGWQPKWLGLMHGQLGPSEVYQRVLAAPVHFNADFNGAVFDARTLDQHLKSTDPAMVRQARAQLDQLLAARGATCTRDRVRELAMVLLPIGRCSIDQVAMHLGVHRSTLHRQLVDEGSGFGEILEQVRKHMATQLIASSQHSFMQISEMLGFSSQPAFSRWHRRSFGETAQAHRQRANPRRSRATAA